MTPNPYRRTLGLVSAIGAPLGLVLFFYAAGFHDPYIGNDGTSGMVLGAGLVIIGSLSLLAWLHAAAMNYPSTPNPEPKGAESGPTIGVL